MKVTVNMPDGDPMLMISIPFEMSDPDALGKMQYITLGEFANPSVTEIDDEVIIDQGCIPADVIIGAPMDAVQPVLSNPDSSKSTSSPSTKTNPVKTDNTPEGSN